MKLRSTRDHNHVVSYEQAIFQGLSPDGGLYTFVSNPDLTKTFSKMTSSWSFQEIAQAMVKALLGDEINPSDCQRLVQSAFPFSPELKKLHVSGKEVPPAILELFHGPSSAFKDFGASFLAHSMAHFLGDKGRRAIILTATSGDTGSAVAQSFFGTENIDVVILYPSGRVSPLQEKQLTTLGGNIHALEIKGSFDDCQRMVKEAFTDDGLRSSLVLSSANSINIGRLLPQSFYYVWARSRYAEKSGDMIKPLPGGVPFIFTVPSGNFGNLTAGTLAWQWGMHVDRFLAATNANDVVPEYLRTSFFEPKSSVHTISNAMDVGNPSNFERMLDIFENNWEAMSSAIAGRKITDQETIETMKQVYGESGEILDPHTAVGVLAARRFLSDCRAGNDSWFGASRSQDSTIISDQDPVMVSLSTAHPGKFVEVVEKAIGQSPALPDNLTELLNREKQAVLMGNNLSELKRFLLDTFG